MRTLNVNVTAELTGSDILQALVNGSDPRQLLETVLGTPGVLSTYLEKHRADVTKAVSNYMSTEHSMRADRIVYENGRVLVHAHSGDQPLSAVVVDEPARERNTPGGHVKPNVGIFQFLREYFRDSKLNKVREVPFEDLLARAQRDFPKLVKRRLQIYLHDTRQLKGVDYDARRGTVILK